MFKKEEAIKTIDEVLATKGYLWSGLGNLILERIMPFIEAYADEAQEDGYSDGYNDTHGWHETDDYP